ncbi:hypothetical protein [Cardinium endosymbiont of Tipula unca]|uniref:hypothetical protein n=1 Tax=Cardinium endosymbiont of Tipula unca TaxID=3066216 RepID=UPI0030CE617B
MLFCSIKGANRGYIQVLLATSRNRIYFRRKSTKYLLLKWFKYINFAATSLYLLNTIDYKI